MARVHAVPDPRDPRGCRYAAGTVLMVALCALACGFDSYRAMGQWAAAAPRSTLVALGCRPRGVFGSVCGPSATTISRFVRKAMPGGIEELLRSFADCLEELKQVAVDGKSLRGSRTRGGPAVMVLGAMTGAGLLVAQQRVPDKTNEITGFAALLSVLDLDGVLVTADALHTQRDHAEVLVGEFGAHYAFTVKRNQPELWAACRKVPWEKVHASHRVTERGHGRTETRTVEAVTWDELDFPHVKQVVRITRRRYLRATREWSREIVYVITSLSSGQADPALIGRAVRAHWGIENKIHYVRDVTLGEDASRIRTGHGPQNMAALRSVTLNFLRRMGTSIADARRVMALRPHTAPLELFGIHADLQG